jgi:drug/metabolite transporter (DMT)-like permease
MMGYGEWAALVAALLWTFSSLFWVSIRLSAWHLNLCKCALGSLFVGGHLLVLAWYFEIQPFVASANAWGWLGLSGLIGIVAGDTLYFRSLQILGPRRALMICTTSPILAIVFGWLILGEVMLPLAIVGVSLTVVGVVLVISDKRAPSESGRLLPGTLQAGILSGLLGSACNAIGAVFSKIAMQSDSEPFRAALEATCIRLLLSGLMILAVVIAQRKLIPLLQQIRRDQLWGRLIFGTALGTWLGIGASMYAYKQVSNIAVAQTLMSTCPLFAIPICWLFYKQRSSLLSMVGTLLAILGIWFAVQVSRNE